MFIIYYLFYFIIFEFQMYPKLKCKNTNVQYYKIYQKNALMSIFIYFLFIYQLRPHFKIIRNINALATLIYNGPKIACSKCQWSLIISSLP